MLDALIRLLLVAVPMSLSMAFYNKIDKEYAITDKVSLKIKVDKKWQPLLVVCCSFAFVTILCIACIVIDIPNNLFFLFGSLIMGINSGFAFRLQNQNKNK